jgi:menaquinone-dependent protoporphyrinogen oxidase
LATRRSAQGHGSATAGVGTGAASTHWATDEIARAIGEVLAEHSLDTTIAAPADVGDVAAYDAVVLGSADAGHWLEPAKALVERSAGAL